MLWLKKNKLGVVLSLLLLVSPFMDAFATSISFGGISLALAFRSIVLVFFMVLGMKFSSREYRFVLLMAAALGGVYLLCHFGGDLLSVNEAVSSELKTFVRFWFLPVSLICLYPVSRRVTFDFTNTILALGAVYVVLFAAAYIAGVDNPAYLNGSNIGYNAWFYSANETGAILSGIVPVYIISANRRRSWYFYVMYAALIFLCLMVGVKSPLIGIGVGVATAIVLLIRHARREARRNVKDFWFVLSGQVFLPALAVIGLFVFSPIADNIQRSTQQSSAQTTSMQRSAEEGSTVQRPSAQKTNLILKLTFNGREKYFEERANDWGAAPMWEKLFGMRSSYLPTEERRYTAELDVVDIFFNFGVTGFALYFVAVASTVVLFVKRFNPDSIVYIAFGASIFVLVFLSVFHSHVMSTGRVPALMFAYMVLPFLTTIGKSEERRLWGRT
jgi:hypothetical protein